MRNLLLAGCLTFGLCSAAAAFEVEDRAVFGAEDAPEVLQIISTADIDFFAPTITAFLAAHPEARVDYTVASSAEVMRALYDEGQSFDIAISSAMDLQTKLANDGHARPHATEGLPDWAVWNEMVFAFTQEPAAMVVSHAAFDGLPLPRSRQELIAVLRQNPERFRGKIGTYDVRPVRAGLSVRYPGRAGVRHLLAADRGDGRAGREALLLLVRDDRRGGQRRAGDRLQRAGQLCREPRRHRCVLDRAAS